MKRYLRIWSRLAVMSFAIQMTSPLSSVGYLLGKIVRIVFFLIFLNAIFRHTDALAGYSLQHASLFFLTFNLVDILAQLFFRGVYGVRSLIREGDLDYYLIQPANVLFRIAFNTVDFLDVVTVAPVLYLTGKSLAEAGSMSLSGLSLYVALVVNGLLIAFAIHIAVASIAVLTQEMENTIWIYRDLMSLGRFPADIYAPAMRAVMTFAIPIAVMTTFPVKALLNQLDSGWILYAFLIAATTVVASLWFWRFAKMRYTSVSS